jgi:type IV pilus assembly protein PilP
MSLWKNPMQRKNDTACRWGVIGVVLILAVPIVSAGKAAETAIYQGSSFHYNPRGKTDPFKPLIRQEVPGQKKGDLRALSPLQRFGLEQLKLRGIMSIENKKVAIVEDPKGKTYVIVKGTAIGQNNGKVSSILDDQVIVEEQQMGDDPRKVQTKRIILNLHRVESEEKL